MGIGAQLIHRWKKEQDDYRNGADTPTGIITDTNKKFRFKRLALNIENLQRDVSLNELKIQQEKSQLVKVSFSFLCGRGDSNSHAVKH